MINNNRRKHYEVNAEVSSQVFSGSVGGTVDFKQDKSLSSRIELKYTVGSGNEESFVLNTKLKDERSDTLFQFDLTRSVSFG